MPRILPTLLFLISTLASQGAGAATLNVDTNNPSCNNVSGNPYCKIKSAVDAAQAGDTISIGAGTYSENGISIGRSLILKGVNARTTIIDGGGSGPRIFTLSAGVTVTMDNLTLQNGKDESGSGGGAIYNQGTLTLKESTLKNNSSTTNGGAIVNTGTITINRCTVSNNSAVYGGGIWHNSGQYSGYMTVESSTFYGNGTTLSGGAMSIDGQTTILNSTIYRNNADTDLDDGGHAGGIAIGDFTWGLYAHGPMDVLYVYLKNTIVAGNRDLSPSQHTPPHDCRGPIYSLGYNLIGIPTSCGEGGTFSSGLSSDIVGPYPPTYSIAVNLGSLANNGGPTDTILPQAGSLAIDAGDPSTCPSTDQRGFVRPSDSNNDSLSACEIGAVEWKTCGDGELHTGEACDDGNRDNSDVCLNSCLTATCGDGFVRTGTEECDGGLSNSDIKKDACRTNCTKPICGDKVVDTGEACDDGNTDNTDSCLTTCVSATCGDGFVQKDVEKCDEGTKNSDQSNATCRTNCLPARCGDGIVDAPDECDAGVLNNDNPNADCRTNCTVAECGDGIIDTLDEECDEGATNSDSPNAICRVDCNLADCGDGIVDTLKEECDAGDNNGSEPDAPCRADCTLAGCGDGILDTDEKCDDGELNGTLGDSCDSACVRILFLDDSSDNNLFDAPVPAGGCGAAIPKKAQGMPN